MQFWGQLEACVHYQTKSDIWTERRGFVTHLWCVVPHHKQAQVRDAIFTQKRFDHFYTITYWGRCLKA
ncbi:hypothetical protein T12_7724 [Trichinella patagoniensis]|uniref:Uncharacterized protein n=1 Tax=Trichinella patagoniensis TaxID=990121 RepID=A0A0V0ZLZ4_9BILA|nr:hypothetical protein T12_7724 [Trichinella patagoniensis]